MHAQYLLSTQVRYNLAQFANWDGIGSHSAGTGNIHTNTLTFEVEEWPADGFLRQRRVVMDYSGKTVTALG